MARNMHSLNLTKENAQVVLRILDQKGIEPDVYDLPVDYSVVTFYTKIPYSLYETLNAYTNPSGNHWDWSLIEDEGE